MSDLISRKAAIDALNDVSENYTGEGKREWHPHLDFMIDAIKGVPPAEPERKKGKWKNTIIFNRTAMVKCSICGGLDLCHADFCHWCGADMREGQDDRT